MLETLLNLDAEIMIFLSIIILISVSSWVIGFYMAYKTNSIKKRRSDFRSIIRSFPDGLVILLDTEAGKVLEMNTNASKALGYSFASELVGKKTNNILIKNTPCTGGACSVHLKDKQGKELKFDAETLNVNNFSTLVRIKDQDVSKNLQQVRSV